MQGQSPSRGIKADLIAFLCNQGLNLGPGAEYLAGIANDMNSGIQIAKETINSGTAFKKLEELVKFTNS